MSTFTTIIQHSFESTSHGNQRKKNKRNSNWKRRSKLKLFADDMILYLGNSKDSTRKLLELFNEFGKVTTTKLIHRNQLHFYILTMKDQKEKSEKPSHLPSHQKE